MTEDVRATTVLLVGALMVRLSAGGTYLRYVQARMGWILLAAGVLLVALGLVGVVHALGSGASGRLPAPGHGHEGHEGHEGHGHGDGEWSGWLLLVPVLALLLVTPPALGSFGVGRSTAAVNVSSGGKTFDPLPAGRVVPMSLLEFDERVADHDGASFGTTPVRLTGFVAATADGPGFRIARYQIACCAADAVASVVRVTGTAGTPPARDQWVTVTGTFHRSADGVPELRATSLTEVPSPLDPYE